MASSNASPTVGAKRPFEAFQAFETHWDGPSLSEIAKAIRADEQKRCEPYTPVDQQMFVSHDFESSNCELDSRFYSSGQRRT